MDQMSVFDILTVSVPESMMLFAIGNYVVTGSLRGNRKSFLWYVPAVLIQCVVCYIARMYLDSTSIIVSLGSVSCAAIMFFLFSYNLRQSIFGSAALFFLSIILGFAALPIVAIVDRLMHAASLYDHRFLITLPERIIQILLLGWLMFNRISISAHRLFTASYDNLEEGDINTIRQICLLYVAAVIMTAGLVDIVAMSFATLDVPRAIPALISLLIGAMIMWYIAIRLSIRTMDYFTKSWVLEGYRDLNERRKKL